MENSTVPIPLENYEDMKKELSSLREEVKQKTIVKYDSRYYLMATYIFLFIMIIIIHLMCYGKQ